MVITMTAKASKISLKAQHPPLLFTKYHTIILQAYDLPCCINSFFFFFSYFFQLFLSPGQYLLLILQHIFTWNNAEWSTIFPGQKRRTKHYHPGLIIQVMATSATLKPVALCWLHTETAVSVVKIGLNENMFGIARLWSWIKTVFGKEKSTLGLWQGSQKKPSEDSWCVSSPVACA